MPARHLSVGQHQAASGLSADQQRLVADLEALPGLAAFQDEQVVPISSTSARAERAGAVENTMVLSSGSGDCMTVLKVVDPPVPLNFLYAPVNRASLKISVRQRDCHDG